MLSEKAIKEFQKIYEEEFAEKIDEQTALDLGTDLLTILDKIYRPIKKEWHENFEEKTSKNMADDSMSHKLGPTHHTEQKYGT